MQITIQLNGAEVSSDIEPRLLLVHWIRDVAGATGTHWGCDTSNCGACVVWLDGVPVKSCTVLAAMADKHSVSTVESLEKNGQLDPIQEGFMQCHGLQCGFCTPGMMMTSRAFLNENPNPSEHEIRDALSGQLCRCTGYDNIIKAVQWAAAHPASEGVSA
jgi:aerobic carbon-monoxide dehydrogenase small subunit